MPEALRALALMVRLSLRADAWRSVGAVSTAVGQMATLPLRAIGLRMLTDGVVGASLPRALAGLTLMVGLTGISRLMAWASLNVRMRLREHTQVFVDAHLMELTAGIPGMEHHERPEYLDNVDLVRAERWALANPFNPLSWTAASVVQVGSAVVLLATVHPLLALLPLGAVPSLLGVLSRERAAAVLREAQAESNRALRHLYDLTTDVGAAKELRIYGLTEHLLDRRRTLFRELEAARLRQGIRRAAIGVGAWLLFAACFIVAVVFTLDLAARQQTSVGSVALVLTLSAQINLQLVILVFNFSWLERTHRAVRRLLWLEDYAASAHSAGLVTTPQPVPTRLVDGIRLTDVTFRYPGTDSPVLEGVNLHLPAGSTVAIVGENGAGKTTLVKLLCRFYDPTQGAITVDGTDLARFSMGEWRSRLSAGFQDFAELRFVARESVGVGNTSHLTDDSWIAGALDRAAASGVLASWPEGLSTQLGRMFDGVELSTGQWQKIALGRAMMRTEPLLLILDEPTASLDAPTEHALFEHFAGAARDMAGRSGAITILVSHRFSTVRMADLILVVSDGRITECGSHDELINAGRLYAELFELQARAYR